jgi:hypothetical protein
MQRASNSPCLTDARCQLKQAENRQKEKKDYNSGLYSCIFLAYFNQNLAFLKVFPTFFPKNFKN